LADIEMTNKQRIDKNNDDLELIEQQIKNLPEAAEPIVTNSDFNYIQAGYTSTSASYCKGYYSQGGGSSNTTVKIYKLNQDGTSTEIYTESGNIGSFCLVDVIDDYLYFYECSYDSTNVIKFYKINLNTYEKESYFNASEPSTYYGWTLYQIPFDNYHFLHQKYYYEIDLENKQIIKKYENTYLSSSRGNVHPRYLTFTSGRSDGYYIYDVETGRNSYTGTIGKGREICFINQSATKVIMAKNLYALNPDLTVGNLIKENVAPDTRIYYCIGHDNLYITSDGWYTFDEETNTFTKTEGLNSVNIYGNTFSFKSANVLNLIIPENFNKIVGYTVGSQDYFSIPDAIVNANDILYGKAYRTNNGSIVQGAMPNNGALSYTPTTSQQTIPEGYTSGGTIGAISDDNLLASNIKDGVTILGVTGTYTGAISQADLDTAEEQISDLFGEEETE
jgi:hypothetical protein